MVGSIPMARAANESSEAPLVDARALPPLDELGRLADELSARRDVTAGGLWGSSQALILALLATRVQGPWIVIASTEAEAEAFSEDLAAFGAESAMLAARDGGGGRGDSELDLDAVRRRLVVAQELAGPPERRPRMLVASILSLLQPIPAPEELARERLELVAGARLDTGALLKRLVGAGYARQPLVERAGEVSLRGDILDLYPFAAELPLRIELFDDEIESIRRFDPALQTSVESVNHALVTLASDPGGIEKGGGVQPASLFSPAALCVEIEPLRVADIAEGLRIRSAPHQRALASLRSAMGERRRLALQSLPGSDVRFDTRSVQSLCTGIRQAPAVLRDATQDGTRIVVACRTEAERHRFDELLGPVDIREAIETRVGNVARGFRIPALKLVVVTHRELAGLSGARRTAPARTLHKTRALQSFFELKPGDYVVHAVHGLALYRGLERMARGAGEEEHLHLEFADEVSLYVPANRIDLVQRYIGSGGSATGSRTARAMQARPPLDKIGGQTFRRRRERVERALFDLAAELLEVQAKRELVTRDPWRPDPALVRDLLGSFPYVDTADQAQVDQEIARDLASEHPMDRLLCGDVGFGKTELAVRAAFRVASAGGQVAVLVPTTVLAHQHHATFRERLADFPVEVAAISRTLTSKEARDVLSRVESGKVDVLIGTHRLLSKDVRFKRLGLLIIDEEQRFGVVQKEQLKALRERVDVLTLSATPIPRTLHMSLSGVRDISALAVPPPGRQEIETVLAESEDDALIRDAIVREKSRGGQVFFLHNRVSTIHEVARRLAQLAPGCSFLVGHGQMGSRELEDVMDAFARGDGDVLVATTIVENGLDIPAAGTIFIDQADHFGLAELHQLRGRVGRGRHKAHCYLLLERSRPVRDAARERLKALEEMNQLGAGFQISMKDLEIRGAGNILGPQQSGHIAAVGYDMYCRLLKHTVERLRAGLSRESVSTDAEIASGVELELGLRAYLPESWIPAQDTRLEILRLLDAVHTDEEAELVANQLRDRFGRLPPEAEALLRQFRLRPKLLALGITRLSWHQEAYLIEFQDRVALEPLAALRIEIRPLRAGVAHLMIPRKFSRAEAALDWLESILRRVANPSPAVPTTP
jgi:transcription-repair coupling factor (superfamily II helicase)